MKLLEFLKKYEEIKNNDKDIIASYVVKIISGTDEVRITHMLDSAYVLSLSKLLASASVEVNHLNLIIDERNDQNN